MGTGSTVHTKKGQSATGNALIELETILFQFGWICATENALMLLKMFSCEFAKTFATGNAFVRLTVLQKAGTQFCIFLP